MQNSADYIKEYFPSEHEEYMNPNQLSYFRNKLVAWRESICQESFEATGLLREKHLNEPDIADRASDELDVSLELRSQDRNRKLLNKINAALSKIESGVYGYCEETGEPIGLKRLEARPTATLSIAAQERHERFEKTHSEE